MTAVKSDIQLIIAINCFGFAVVFMGLGSILQAIVRINKPPKIRP